jgi:CRISPR-associated protein Cmr4
MPGIEDFVRIKNYLVMATEPVHVGAGGYRLGQVDNTIIREPATNLPKLPGTGLAGVARTYTAMAVQAESPQDPDKQKFKRKVRGLKYNPDGSFERDDAGNPLYKEEYYSCAGKGGGEGEEHCGDRGCPVCVPFGFSKGKSGSSFQGLAGFSDAHILLFPVNSMKGPVWITAPGVVEQFLEDDRVSGEPLDVSLLHRKKIQDDHHIVTSRTIPSPRGNSGPHGAGGGCHISPPGKRQPGGPYLGGH